MRCATLPYIHHVVVSPAPRQKAILFGWDSLDLSKYPLAAESFLKFYSAPLPSPASPLQLRSAATSAQTKTPGDHKSTANVSPAPPALDIRSVLGFCWSVSVEFWFCRVTIRQDIMMEICEAFNISECVPIRQALQQQKVRGSREALFQRLLALYSNVRHLQYASSPRFCTRLSD
jgi:hypothetical protein